MKKNKLILGLGFFLFALTLLVYDKGQNLKAESVDVTLPTSQIIIQFADPATELALLSRSEQNELATLSQAAGVPLQYVREMSGDAHVLKLDGPLPADEVAAIAANLTAVAGVLYAEPDRIKTIDGRAQQILFAPELTPNDTYFADQWHYQYSAGTAEGLNLVNGWNITTGNASTVVAVIDTGVLLGHSDLAGRLVPGYDFIADPFVANDGDGRDANPADPGDWVDANQCGGPHAAQPSSWHGTHVAGTIGAATNNNVGVAGVNWQAKLLPVRVLGKCGGYTSDIVDGMRWAAGLAVPGVPANANPAKVLNLSLGGPGACSSTEQNAINNIVGIGATVVIAAGNSNTGAAGFSPANCNQVITVAATNRVGSRSYYSNYDHTIEVSAPGGETHINSANGVLSTLDTGTTTPANSNSYAYYQGTSMAAPHVAGLASLIVGMRPHYNTWQVLNLLQDTARPFPSGSSCNTSNCGAGIVDAYQALTEIDSVEYGPHKAYLPVIVKGNTTTPPPATSFVNPGFESGPAGWTQYSSGGWDIIINSGFPKGLTPHGGSWAGWLGGDYYDTSYVVQTVTVPVSATYLSYWHWIASLDSCGSDKATVAVGATAVHQYDLCQATNTYGWVRKTVNLFPYAGQTVQIAVGVTTNGSLNSNLFIDDFSFQATASSAELLPANGLQVTEPRSE